MTSEHELIERIRSRLKERGDRVVLASGDDAAVTRCSGVIVTSVDSFVEGVHFRLATTSLADLGHKCLAAALSDLAAMGAVAGEAYLAVGLPPNLGERETLELVEGAEQLASELGTCICGGDLTRSSELFVSVTAIGHAAREEELVGRGGAGAGDLVGVTGALGGAGAGLILLEQKGHGVPAEAGERLLERQRRPYPQLEAGRLLARAGASAMIDLSDGVAADCERIAEESAVQVVVELASLPLDDGVDTVAEMVGLEGAELAASAGEDYELLFTAPPSARAAIESAAEGDRLAVTWIGETRVGSGVRLLDERGRHRSLYGWDHLAHRPGRSPHPRAQASR